MSCASGPRGRALEALADPARAKSAIRRIADELGDHPEALRTWVKKAQIDQGTRPGTTTDEAQRIKELEKEVRELRRANAILKSASACLSRRSVSAYLVDLPVHRLPNPFNLPHRRLQLLWRPEVSQAMRQHSRRLETAAWYKPAGSQADQSCEASCVEQLAHRPKNSAVCSIWVKPCWAETRRIHPSSSPPATSTV